jgi:tetratricopeptide (TPR) repeat protein
VTDDRGAAERAFQEAVVMPPGMPRHEALERAARLADAAEANALAVTCRIALIESCYQLNRYDLMLAPVAWCRSAEQRDPESFGEDERHALHWAHKWVPAGLLRDPRFALAQVTSVVDDLEERYRRAGFALQPVHGLRVEVADHIGDLAAGEHHFALFLAADRDSMSDCPACVVEEQVRYLIRRGRFAEAVRYADPVLRGEFTCSTQPQGVLTALLPALLAVGEPDRAREAHLYAYRRIRDRARSWHVHEHLTFCATTGNVARGMEILRQHLDRVHQPANPSDAMHFAAGAAILLSRLDSSELRYAELSLPRAEGLGPRIVTAEELRTELTATALNTAAEFDRRNGTTRQSEIIQELLDIKDTIRVPLALPAPVADSSGYASSVDDDIPADPTALARQVMQAYESGELFAGYRLMSSLPVDLNPLLPEGLAAYLDARRAIESEEDDHDQARAMLTDAVQRLRAAGEVDAAARFLARLASWYGQDGDLEHAVRLCREALAEAEESGTTGTRVLALLRLSELLDYQQDHERAGELLAEATRLAEADAADLVPAARLVRAEHLARRQDFDAADVAMAEVLARPDLTPAVLFHGLLAHTYVAAVRHDVDRAMDTSARLVALARSAPGPWLADALLRRAELIDSFGRNGEHLADLVDTVAACRAHRSGPHTARACYLLSHGYLEHGRVVEAAETLEEALHLLTGSDRTDELLSVRYRLAAVCGRLGEHAAAKKHFTATLDLLTDAAITSHAMVWDGLGLANANLDDPAEAARCYQRAAGYWEQAEETAPACRSWVAAATAMADNAPEDAMDWLGRALRLVPAEESPVRTRLVLEVLEIRGYLHAAQRRFAEARTDNEEAANLAAELGQPDWQAFFVVRGAQNRLAEGDPVAAEQQARVASKLLGPDSAPGNIGRVLETLGTALNAQGKPVHADELVRELTARLNR